MVGENKLKACEPRPVGDHEEYARPHRVRIHWQCSSESSLPGGATAHRSGELSTICCGFPIFDMMRGEILNNGTAPVALLQSCSEMCVRRLSRQQQGTMFMKSCRLCLRCNAVSRSCAAVRQLSLKTTVPRSVSIWIRYDLWKQEGVW